MRAVLRRKKLRGWKMLTLAQKVDILQMILHHNLRRGDIAEAIGCSRSTVGKVQREYCDTVTIVRVKLKPEKKAMARLLEARTEEPTLPGIPLPG